MNEDLRLIELIYSTAMDGRDWSLLMEEITTSVGGNGALLRLMDHQTQQVGFAHAVGYDQSYVEAYQKHFVHVDHYQPTFNTAQTGVLLTTEDVLSHQERNKSEYFNDFEKPQDKFYVAGGILAREGTSAIQAGIQRGKKAGNWKPQNLQRLRLLFPHLARAVQINQLISKVNVQRDIALASLNELRAGVILTDASAKPFFLNSEAEKLIAGTGELTVRADGLAMRKSSDTTKLRTLITFAALTTSSQSLNAGGEFCVAAGPGEKMLQIRVSPLSRKHIPNELFMPAACAAVFLSRSDALQLPWQKIAVFYGLTRAEAKLAVALIDGSTLEDIAEQTQVSIHTIRTQVKAVFAKTGTQRQTELVSMLLQGILAIFHTEEKNAHK